MPLLQDLLSKNTSLSVIGLGYVGLPVAVSFSRVLRVVGYDVNQEKIGLYRAGIDPTREVGNEAVQNCGIDFTTDQTKLRDAKFHIVAVPTPIHSDHSPDLTAVIGASELLGRNLVRGSVVVYESTVYPGVTEEICIPALERESGLKCGADFTVGYSPERINPGDKLRRLETIVKIVSAIDAETLGIVARVYELVVQAGVFRAESIKVAEAAKVIENSQRDINIAFMNELSIIFNKLGVDTKAVLEAAGTKWNFLNFVPGLVGGHCIGVDPYYLTYKAEQLGYHSQIILSGRRINDSMGKYVAENLIKSLIKADLPVKGAKVAILGFTFKENCPDTRNTRVIDIYRELTDYGIFPLLFDPVADRQEARREYGVSFTDLSRIRGVDTIVVPVAHKEWSALEKPDLDRMFSAAPGKKKVLLDLKGIWDRRDFPAEEYIYWRL